MLVCVSAHVWVGTQVRRASCSLAPQWAPLGLLTAPCGVRLLHFGKESDHGNSVLLSVTSWPCFLL